MIRTRNRRLVRITWVVITAPVAAMLGLAIPWAAANPLLVTTLVFVGVVLAFEIVRRTKAASLPLSIAYISLVPWAAIVLFPWLYAAVRGSWIRLGVQLDLGLPRTYRFHLLALLGMVVGSIPGLLRRYEPPAGHAVVRWRLTSVVISGFLALYALSFVLADRGATALWKLGGAVVYHEETDAAVRIALLDFMPTIATAVLLVAATVRRRLRTYPAAAEVLWLSVLGVLALGSGVRARLYLLVLGWLMIQFGPVLRQRARSGVKTAAVVGGGLAVVTAGLWIAGPISQVRSGQVDRSRSPFEVAIQGIDVISTGEALFSRGATPGMLGGKSYSELPSLLLPRRFVGDAKPNPSADVLMRNLLDARAGYSAPLWLEGALNFGAMGVVLFAASYSWLFVSILHGRGRNNRFMVVVRLLGPVWLLASYIVLSHLTLLHLIATIGSILVGVAVGTASLKWEGSPATSSNLLATGHPYQVALSGR